MNYIKELSIDKELFEHFKNSDIKVSKLNINTSPDDIFYYKNLDFFLKNKNNQILIDVSRYHNEKLNEKEKEEIKQIVIDSNDHIFLGLYAKDILKKRWIDDESLPLSKRKEIESKIASNNQGIFYYMNYILKDRWLEEEPRISRSSFSTQYVKKFLRKRWIEAENIDPKITKEAENIILRQAHTLPLYLNFVKTRWPEFEKKITDLPSNITKAYFINIKVRIPELEDFISKDPLLSLVYSENVLNKSWSDMKGIISDKIIKQAEDSIYSDRTHTLEYSVKTSKRLPSNIEHKIFNHYFMYKVYDYVKKIINKRIPEFEKNLIKLKKLINNHPRDFASYIQNNFPNNNLHDFNLYEDDDATIEKKLEDIKLQILNVIYLYTKNIIKGPWPEIGINNENDLKKIKDEIKKLDRFQTYYDELDNRE